MPWQPQRGTCIKAHRKEDSLRKKERAWSSMLAWDWSRHRLVVRGGMRLSADSQHTRHMQAAHPAAGVTKDIVLEGGV